MMLAMRGRRWWLRVPLFILSMTCLMVVGWFLCLTNPTISLGRDLSALDETDQIAVLAMIDQMKINRHMPDGDPFAVVSTGSQRGTPFCRDTGDVAQAITQAANALGAKGGRIHCEPEVGYFFQINDPGGEIVAGYRCDGWCGSGNTYTLTRLGSVLILWRTGEVMM